MVSRAWCLSVFGPTSDVESLSSPDEVEIVLSTMSDFRYAVYQAEECPTTGRAHYQMYIEFAKPKRMTFLKRYFGRAHCEPRKGTRYEARVYCMKEESRIHGPYEVGDFAAGIRQRSTIIYGRDVRDGGEIRLLTRTATTLYYDDGSVETFVTPHIAPYVTYDD